jgi:hypothetical protein
MDLNTFPWVFSHIPKTAGTSVESYLAQLVGLKDILHVNAPDLNRLPQVLYLKNKYPKLIMGHHPFHGLLYQLLGEHKIVHLSMMREPISRVVSYYNYVSTRNYHALHKSVAHLSFDGFLAESQLTELSNGQAKRLAGTLHNSVGLTDQELYLKAKYTIDHCFSLVGVTEHFKEYIQLIAKKCGVKFIELPPINRSEIKIQLADLTTAQKKVVSEMNKVDIQLYQYVKAKFLARTSYR